MGLLINWNGQRKNLYTGGHTNRILENQKGNRIKTVGETKKKKRKTTQYPRTVEQL